MSVILSDRAIPGDARMMGTSEALGRLGAGRDGEAWTAILERHGADILRMAQRITGDGAMCEDICQETLLQIRAYAGRFRPPENQADAEAAAKGWVMCIAYRTALGMLRLRQRRDQSETRAGLELLARLPDDREPILNAEQLALLRREVSDLPDLLRSAVCLHFYGQMTYPELSATLECSEKAARKRVERGVKRLRDRLAYGGLSLGVGTLMLTLGGPAHAAAGAATALATATTVSNLVPLQSLARWQALLNSSTVPALSGVAKIGVAAIMTKYVVGAAALVALSLSGVQTYQLSTLNRQLNDARERAESAADMQGKVSALERQLAENRGDMAAMKASLATRGEDISRLEKSLDQRGNSGSISGFGGGPVTMAFPPGAGGPGGHVTWDAATAATPGAAGTMTFKKTLTKDGNMIVQHFIQDAEGKEGAMPLPPPGADMVIKKLDNGVVQYETPDGKIIARNEKLLIDKAMQEVQTHRELAEQQVRMAQDRAKIAADQYNALQNERKRAARAGNAAAAGAPAADPATAVPGFGMGAGTSTAGQPGAGNKGITGQMPIPTAPKVYAPQPVKPPKAPANDQNQNF